MRKPKLQRDETEKQVEECRKLGRVCFMIILLFVVWGLFYMPIKTISHIPLPESLSWMVSQRNLNRFIVPDNNTSLLLPRQQCNGSVYIVVIVCSAVPNFDARDAIRSTWGQYAAAQHNLRVFFLLGKSGNETLNAAVLDESSLHSDIIQQDFLDTYNNLTLKSVMLLKWVNQNCGNAKYVMKTDDDMFVHLPNLFKLLKAKGHTSMLLGCLIKGATPVKDWNSKWYVPDVVFSKRTYPHYLSGTGYVLSRDTVPILYRTALKMQFFYLEDIFITGMCASKAGLVPVNHEGFKFYKRKNDLCVFKSLITAHKMTPKELLKIWKKLQTPSSIKCKS